MCRTVASIEQRRTNARHCKWLVCKRVRITLGESRRCHTRVMVAVINLHDLLGCNFLPEDSESLKETAVLYFVVCLHVFDAEVLAHEEFGK